MTSCKADSLFVVTFPALARSSAGSPALSQRRSQSSLIGRRDLTAAVTAKCFYRGRMRQDKIQGLVPPDLDSYRF